MSTELRPHKGINVATKKEVCFQQYLIFDGHPDKMERVGIIGWKPGDKIIFLVPVDPIRADRITVFVSEQLKRETELINCPDIPEDLLHPPTKESYDEFNESDLT
jgi:hypothetical protein